MRVSSVIVSGIINCELREIPLFLWVLIVTSVNKVWDVRFQIVLQTLKVLTYFDAFAKKSWSGQNCVRVSDV